MSQVNNFSEIVGHNCYTSPKWNRDVCQATRIEYVGNRFYNHGQDAAGNGIYRKGATFLSDAIATLTGENKFLESWRKDMTNKLGSADKFDQFMQSMADFGTSGHIAYDMMIQGLATEAYIAEEVTNFALEHGLPKKAILKTIETAKKNLLAFRQFNIESEITVYAVEQMVTSPLLGTSTPVDILATGMFSATKGARKEKCWLLGNLKTSENAQNHSWQCAIEYMCAMDSIVAQMLEIEDLKIVTGTVRPTDWRDTPNFEFKSYTDFAKDPKNQERIKAVADILMQSGRMNPPSIKTITWDGPLLPDTEFTFQPIFV